MTRSKEIFMQERENELNEEIYSEQVEQFERLTESASKPQELQIVPGTILTLSKANAAAFHEQMRTMALETGYGMFEYLETVKFFCKLNDVIFGKDDNPGDKEFIDAIREELKKYNGKLTTPRGVRFEAAETGTKYDYSQNQDWVILDKEVKELQERKKALEEKLKKVESGKMLVDPETGETIIGPAKTSKSSIKITMAR